jgi:hypothetical protein
MGSLPVLRQSRPECVSQEREARVLESTRAARVLAVHEPGLGRMQLQPDLGHPRCEIGQDLSVALADAMNHRVIAVPFEAARGCSRDSQVSNA